jgi:hypothetical protein
MYLEFLTNLNVFSSPQYEKVVFGMQSVCVYEYMYMFPSLVPEPLDRFYSCAVLKSLSVIGQCPVNTNILAPDIGTLHNSLKKNRNVTVFSTKSIHFD